MVNFSGCSSLQRSPIIFHTNGEGAPCKSSVLIYNGLIMAEARGNLRIDDGKGYGKRLKRNRVFHALTLNGLATALVLFYVGV